MRHCWIGLRRLLRAGSSFLSGDEEEEAPSSPEGGCLQYEDRKEATSEVVLEGGEGDAVYFQRVRPGSHAEKAGVRVGDEVLQVNLIDPNVLFWRPAEEILPAIVGPVLLQWQRRPAQKVGERTRINSRRSRSSLPHRCNVAAAVEDMTVAEEIARMDAQLDQLQELSNEVFRRDPNADVPQNIQAIRTDVHQLVEQGTAQQQAAAAKRYGEAFQKTCEATNRFVRACQDGTEKERAMAGIEIVSQVSAAFPPPYGPAMGGLCSLTTLVMDLAWDSPSKSPFEVMLEAIQKMIDEAVCELKNYMDEKFNELYQRMARSEAAAIKHQSRLILAEARGFQQLRPQQQRVACQSLVRVTETAGVAIAASFGRVVDCITDLCNFRTRKYRHNLLPVHLRGHYGLNCEQLKKGVGFVREVERAINSMYTVVGWRLNHMHQVIDAQLMHNRKTHFQNTAREALESVYADLGDWEDDRSMQKARKEYAGQIAKALLGSLVSVEMRPHGGALVRIVVPERLRKALEKEARAIRQLRQHVQHLHDQI